MKRNFTLFLALLLAVCFFAAGNASSEELAAEQIYRTYLWEEPFTLDNILNSQAQGEVVLRDLMEPLTRLIGNPDGSYAVEMAGAESYDVSADGLVWTFKLRDNKWSDGQPVTAEDYAYALRRLVDPATASTSADFVDCIAGWDEVYNNGASPDELGVKALDDKTLEITLSEPVFFFECLTYSQFLTPQRKDKVEEWGDKYGSDAEYIICCGPFKVDSWTHNSSIVLSKNEYYWDAASVILEGIIWNIFPDQNTQMNASEAGEVDGCEPNDDDWLNLFLSKEGMQRYDVSYQTVGYHMYNCEDELTGNANIRRALQLTIVNNLEDMCETIWPGTWFPVYGWVVPAITVGEIPFRDTLGDTTKEIAEASGDPKALLLKGMEELGLGDDPAALDLTFTLAGTTQKHHEQGEYVQQLYKKELGIDLKLDFVEYGIFSSSIAPAGDYQITALTWGAYYNDPCDVLRVLISSFDWHDGHWANDTFDGLMRQAMSELDAAKRLELCSQAERVMLEDAPVCPVRYQWQANLYQPNVRGAVPTSFGNEGFKGVYKVITD